MTESPVSYYRDVGSVSVKQDKPISVPEAAAALGISPQFLRLGLQQGRFPFGTAVKMKRWAYYINSERFYAYIRKEVS